jgi:hypothetical protein
LASFCAGSKCSEITLVDSSAHLQTQENTEKKLSDSRTTLRNIYLLSIKQSVITKNNNNKPIKLKGCYISRIAFIKMPAQSYVAGSQHNEEWFCAFMVLSYKLKLN